MKIKMLAIAAAVIASLAINTTHAQTVAMNTEFKPASALQRTGNVNDKIQARFEKEYPNAGNVNWVASKNGYDARFLNNGIDAEVRYNKAGRADYYIERYAANQLPKAIASEINDAYKEYDIIGATEIHSAGQVGYLINIQSKKFSKIIRVNNDGMDVYQDIAL